MTPVPRVVGFIPSAIYAFRHENPKIEAALRRTLKRGSPRGFLVEDIVSVQFSDLFEAVPQSKGYDLSPKHPGFRCVEIKCTGANGAADFKPSGGKGEGRTPKVDQFWSNCEETDYLLVDSDHLIATGHIRYVVFTGSHLKELQRDTLKKKEVVQIFADAFPE